MKVYDVNTKETRNFVDGEVLDFQLSPDKNQFIVDVYNEDKQVNDLIVTDLDSKKIKVLDESIFGSSWSPDGTKVSYISNKEDD